MKIKYEGAGRPGFSLTEMLVGVLIMGVLVGVVGSLMGGFVTNFEMTDDQSIARRRAQDVFNILQVPILNAGLGIPPVSFDYYFAGAPIEGWNGPIPEVISNSNDRGDVLSVVYSVYSGFKNVSGDIDDFSGNGPGDVENVLMSLRGANPIGEADGIQIADSTARPMRSYITFPGISMHPEIVKNFTETEENGVITLTLTLSGKKPHTEGSPLGMSPNMIMSYHDMFLVRAGLAYVDDNGTFCLYDINDIIGTKLPTASSADELATRKLVYRVEGIKAVRFERVTSGDMVTGVNVYVLAEGDNTITERTSGDALSELKKRWPDTIELDDGMYYEDFEMRWRTRNIEAPTPTTP